MIGGGWLWIGSAQTLVAIGRASHASVLLGFEKMECLKHRLLIVRIAHLDGFKNTRLHLWQ